MSEPGYPHPYGGSGRQTMIGGDMLKVALGEPKAIQLRQIDGSPIPPDITWEGLGSLAGAAHYTLTPGVQKFFDHVLRGGRWYRDRRGMIVLDGYRERHVTGRWRRRQPQSAKARRTRRVRRKLRRWHS